MNNNSPGFMGFGEFRLMSSTASATLFVAYAFGVLFAVLHLFLRHAGLMEAFRSASLAVTGFGHLGDGSVSFTGPALALLALFALPLALKRGEVRLYLVKAYLVILFFSFVCLRLAAVMETGSTANATPVSIGFARSFAFMVTYGVPITAAILLVRGSRRDLVTEVLVFAGFTLASQLPQLVEGRFALGTVFFALHKVGILYFAGLLIGLYAVVDSAAASADADSEEPLKRNIFVLAAFLVSTILAVALLHPSVMAICSLLGADGGASPERYAPFTQTYVYLSELVTFSGGLDLLDSLLTLGGLVSIAVVLLLKARRSLSIRVGRFKSLLGYGAICYYLTQPFEQKRLVALVWLAVVMAFIYGAMRLRAWVRE